MNPMLWKPEGRPADYNAALFAVPVSREVTCHGKLKTPQSILIEVHASSGTGSAQEARYGTR